jgi:hypothetical protein
MMPLYRRVALYSFHLLVVIVMISASKSFVPIGAAAFSAAAFTRGTILRSRTSLPLHLDKKQSRADVVIEKDEVLEQIEGAQFFGGNKQKEEFFDPVAEAEATVEVSSDDVFDRFADRNAFRDDFAASVARDVQTIINGVLFEEDDNDSVSATEYSYGTPLDAFQWSTPLPVKSLQMQKSQLTEKATNTKNPVLQELQAALSFYNRVDVAVVAGESRAPNSVSLRFEISVTWPTFWEPRVVLSGTSILTINKDKKIINQLDTLDSNDWIADIQKQILPRFWDMYHIGMTPAAEVRVPMNEQKPLFRAYSVRETPPRLVLQASQLDLGTRDDYNALILPNHAFSTVIKTMGPTRQRYVTVSGVEVQIIPETNNRLRLQWSIPIAVEFLSQPKLLLGGRDDEENLELNDAKCQYVFQTERRVATVPFGGQGPQDAQVTAVRKKLYEQVTNDGHTPILDSNGRPVFFFVQNAVKACYTNEGLGMAVYEWRPQFSKPNEVGIELE